MFTDMAGYTALLQADERLALDRRERYWDALERHHAAFGGTIVQRLGDGSMSMFPSSLAAIQAAVAMQQELAPQNVEVRIGVHVGEVIIERERLTGEAVNIASRIESFAVPGGVGKTRLVAELGRRLAPEFLDGVAFVSMIEVMERADFLPALADALDVKEAEERTLAEGVVALIGDKKALLLLDNLEQVVEAA